MYDHASHLSLNDSTGMLTGRIEGRIDAIYTLRSTHGVYQAHKAVSCLIEPETGDTVLCGKDEVGHLFILAILMRPNATPSKIAFPDGVSVSAPGNRFDIDAEHVAIQANDTLQLAGRSTHLDADETVMRTRTFSLFSSILHAGVGIAEVIAESLDSVCDRVVARSKCSYRYVEELEQACLGRFRCLVDGSLFMRGRKASLNAEETVTIDGEEVHLG
ncbi:DUF3540 domain-containing protein [Desulfovibrio inopinatus]|uniref:DUF3540 domain-containing protein n=1 Tax=Desulfovibrio inopinatus TaxID=102109 RepID=UPI000408A9F8|nr:DUF3540 domain-containing protein [Desulfovibrio inopinatus]